MHDWCVSTHTISSVVPPGGALLNCFTLQCPNLPVIGYTQSILMRDSQGRDSFTEDALLSVSDYLLPVLTLNDSEEHCLREQRTIVRDAGPGVATAVSFRPLC